MTKALITGVTGQDGSYLAEFLLDKGYEVWGMVRRSSSPNTERIDHLLVDRYDPGLRLVYGNLADAGRLIAIVNDINPDEIYNLGAQSHVRMSFDEPEYSADINGLGALRMLEATRNMAQPAKFYQASTSEIFGLASETPQNEKTPFHPRSPYACSKLFGYWQAVNYREAYGLHASNGILFNHESPRRGESFVTRKITRGATRIKLGLQSKLYLGNIDAKRDWGFAREFVGAMWLMLQQDEPSDYVIATGETHSVKEFLGEVFGVLDLDWTEYVEFDERYLRPSEVDALTGDTSKARKELGWKPETSFKELARIMTESDLELARQELAASGSV